jgi:hypothetical protein
MPQEIEKMMEALASQVAEKLASAIVSYQGTTLQITEGAICGIVSYQGMTSVVPQDVENTMGFSPCVATDKRILQ